jgi:hypothetical protein
MVDQNTGGVNYQARDSAAIATVERGVMEEKDKLWGRMARLMG